MKSNEQKNKHKWVEDFEQNGINITGILKKLSEKDWAQDCVPIIENADNIINKYSKKYRRTEPNFDFDDFEIFPDMIYADALYIIADGRIAIGELELHPQNSTDYYYYERLNLTPHSFLGDFEIPIKINGLSFKSTAIQQRAWFSCEALSELVAYKVTDKHNPDTISASSEYLKYLKGNQWALLKIPKNLIEKFIKDESLKNALLLDAYAKSRYYFIFPKGKRFKGKRIPSHLNKEEMKQRKELREEEKEYRHAEYLIRNLEAFYKMRTTLGYTYDDNKTIKIFGSTRFEVICETKGIKIQWDKTRMYYEPPIVQIMKEKAKEKGFTLESKRVGEGKEPINQLKCGKGVSCRNVIYLTKHKV